MDEVVLNQPVPSAAAVWWQIIKRTGKVAHNLEYIEFLNLEEKKSKHEKTILTIMRSRKRFDYIC